MESTTNISLRITSAILLRHFLKLPYDIRALVYEQFDDLPPATNGGSFSGFTLSCKQAKSEVEHIATVRAKKHLRNFKALLLSKAGVQADISTYLAAIDGNPCFSQLRQVDITVPFNKIFTTPGIELFVYGYQKFSYRFVMGALRSIHTLLSKHYNTVHIRLSGDPPKRENGVSTPDNVTQRMYGPVEDIAWIIEHTNSGRLQPRLSMDPLTGLTGMALRYELDRHAYSIYANGDAHAYHMPVMFADKPPTTMCYTKEFRLSWDLRTEKDHGTPSRLEGQAHRPRDPLSGPKGQRVGEAVLDDSLFVQPKEEYLRDVARLPIFFHAHNDDRTVADMDFRGSNRWQKSHPDYYIELDCAVPDLDDGFTPDHLYTALTADVTSADC